MPHTCKTTTRLLPILLLLSCTEHYIDSEIPDIPKDTIIDSVIYDPCVLNGTCTFLVTNKCPYNITVKVSTDTFYVTELPFDSTYTFPPLPAKGFYLMETDKYMGGNWNVWYVRLDTCEVARAIFSPNILKRDSVKIKLNEL